MARIREISYTDDLDRAEGRETEATHHVRFGFGGYIYDLDLSKENFTELQEFLQPFINASRRGGYMPVRKVEPSGRFPLDDAPKAPRQPMTAPAGEGATLSRHQGGIDPKAARAWAVENGVEVPQRGRLPKEIKDAYNADRKFGDKAPLKRLLDAQAGTLLDPVTEFAKAAGITEQAEEPPEQPAEEQAPATEDPNEAEAARHYRRIQYSGRVRDDKTWKNRTAGGCDRTDKVEQMTLTERVAALSDKNVTMLGQLAGITALKNGKVPQLAGSSARLENLEFIEEDKGSPHGWAITEFGRYAHQVRSH